MPGRPSADLTPVGTAIMDRAAAQGYPKTDALAAAARLSNRTVWALCYGERSEFSGTTLTRLEEVLLLERGSLGEALRTGDPLELRFTAEVSEHREHRRQVVTRMLAQGGVSRDPAALRNGASRLRAAAPSKDAELLGLAALAELVAACLDGTDGGRSTFEERLASHPALTGRDREALARTRRPSGSGRRGADDEPGIPPVVFRAVHL